MKKIAVLVSFVLFSIGLNAQSKSMKMAYINEDYVFDNYKGLENINKEIESRQSTFQEEFNKIALEYQQANLDYQNGLKNIAKESSETINDKLKKVQELKVAAENYQRESEKNLQEYIGVSVAAVKAKIEEAAKEVAKQKSIAYVLSRNLAEDSMTPFRTILASNGAHAINISDEVLKIMNK